MRLLPLLVGACCKLPLASAAGSRSRFQGGHTPWATVRALLGSSRSSQPAAPAAPPMAPAAPAAPAAPPIVPPAPGAPASTEPMPQWAQTQLNVAGVPAAAPASAGPTTASAGPAKDPCYACLAKDNKTVNTDMQEVAADKAETEVQDAAADARKDSQSAIAHEGKRNLRSVQASNNAAVDEASDRLKASADEQKAIMEADAAKTMTDAEHDSHVEGEFAKLLTEEGITKEGAKTSAKYIADAQRLVGDLVKKIRKAGKEMGKELNTTASVGEQATNVTERYVLKAQGFADYAEHFMDVPLAELHQAQIAANFTEDVVHTEALATKFGSQAVEHGKEEAKKAEHQAVSANQTSKFIFTKVMKTKAGIVQATEDVEAALVKAENAHIEAQSAEFQAAKLLKKLA